MTPPKTPDDEPGGDRPQAESPEQPAPESGPAAPPPPQWLDEGQLLPGAHLLPEPPPLPPLSPAGADEPEPEPEPDDELPETEQTTFDPPESDLPPAEQTTFDPPKTEQTTFDSPETEQTTFDPPKAEQTTFDSPETEQTTLDPPDDDFDSTQVFDPRTPPAVPPPPQSFTTPPPPDARSGSGEGPRLDETVMDLSAHLPAKEKSDEEQPGTEEIRPEVIGSAASVPGPDAKPAGEEPDSAPGNDKTSAFPSAPESRATQQMPNAKSLAESGAGPAEEPPAPPAPPAPAPAPPPATRAEPFPWAQEVPETPFAVPPPAVPPAFQTPSPAPPAPEPFPYAQQIPDTPLPAPTPPAPPAPPAPAPPPVTRAEPFPWAQEIPDTPRPPLPQQSAHQSPPAAEPFPWAQQMPGPQAPQPQPQPISPPPQINEPWRTEAKPKRKGPKLNKKALLIGIGGLAAAALVAAGGFFAVNLVGGGSDDESGAKLAGSVFAIDPNARTDGRDQHLTAAAAVGRTVVTVGAESDGRLPRGQFLVSGDGGRTFKPGEVRGAGGDGLAKGEVPRVVAGSAKGWVAIGTRPGGGAVWTSQDGKSWNRLPDNAGQPFGPNTRVRRAVASDAGFLAFGDTTKKGDFSDAEPTVWTSSDGNGWEVRTGNRIGLPIQRGTVNLLEAAGSGDVMLLEGLHTANPGGGKLQQGRRVFRSADGGKSWTESKVPVPKGTRGLIVGGGPGGFLAIREIQGGGRTYGQAFTSRDGSTWTQSGRLASPGYQRTSRILASGEGYAAIVVRGRDIAISRSADGSAWQDTGSLANQPGRVLNGSALSSGQIVLVGAENGGGELNAMLGVYDSGGTPLPVDISKVPGAVRPDHTVAAIAAGSDRAVAVGSARGDAGVWTSTDGAAWTRAQAGQGVLSRPGPQQLVGVTQGRAGWLAVGTDQANPRRPLVVTSADGATWQAGDSAERFKPARNTPLATYATASGPAGYVIVGEDGLSAATWFSADLKTWQRGRSVGDNGLDALPNSNRWMRGVAAGQSGYVAVGGVRDPGAGNAPAARPAVWTSPDGKAWTMQQLQLPGGVAEAALTHVAAKGNTLVAAGSAGSAPLFYVSADGGKTWKETKPAVPDGVSNVQVTALTATPKGFAATGTGGGQGSTDVVSWTSADGSSWQAAKPEGTGLAGGGAQSIGGLATFKDRLLGVGRTADQTRDQPVLWDRPVP
ncbi:hypothetical protein GCM10010191_44330 [Actinomadura vinacea]|uniref:Exo-alpha-sialidase n=1 Tax=Actinomadura vinacea TaxID=115336 RepID=A0ABP5WGB8_9ACTN